MSPGTSQPLSTTEEEEDIYLATNNSNPRQFRT